MSLIIMESADLANLIPYAGSKWSYLDNNAIVPTTVGGRVCWRFWNNDDAFVKIFPTQEDDTIIAGARLYGGQQDVLNANTGIFTLREGESIGGTWHLTVLNDVQGVLEVRRGNSVTLGRTANYVFPEQKWFYLEMKAVIHDTTGSVELRVDGNTVLNLTGIDTRNGGADGLIDTFGFGGRFTNWYGRDFYLLNGLGSQLNDFLGPQKIQARLPNGAGDFTGWTPNTGTNFGAVDEGDPDEDTTYVAAGTAALRDSYAVSDFDVADSINGVQISAIGRYVDTPLDVASFIRRSGTNVDGSAETPSGSYVSLGHQVWEDDPVAAAPWTLANLNDTQVGILSS